MSDRDEWDYGPFQVGDMVEGFGMIYDTISNGLKGNVVGGLDVREGTHPITGDEIVPCYVIEWQDGRTRYVRMGKLRRRKPPMTGLQDVLAMFDKQPDRVKELA